MLVNGSDDLNMSKEIKTKKNELKGKGASHVKISVFIATTLLLSTYIPNDLQKSNYLVLLIVLQSFNIKFF